MSKPDMIFIWHSAMEVPVVYESFVQAFVGKRSIPIVDYDPDGGDTDSVTREEIIPSAVARSHTVIMLLSGDEKEDGEFGRLLQSIAYAPHRVAFATVFLRKAAKDWWSAKVDPRIQGLIDRRAGAIEAWSPLDDRKAASFSGQNMDTTCVTRVQELRRSIETKVRELDVFPSGASAATWRGFEGRRVILLSPREQEHAALERDLTSELGALPDGQTVIPINWPAGWQERSSQAHYIHLFGQPALFVRIIAHASIDKASQADADFWRDVHGAIGLGDIDFGEQWNAIVRSSRFDWAPNVGQVATSDSSTFSMRAGISAKVLALEIGRTLGLVKPAPPRVSYITIARDKIRSTLVSDPETFEANLNKGLRDALKTVLEEHCTPAELNIIPYHQKSYEEMIDKEIRSSTIPVLLADDLWRSAQKPDIVDVLKAWETRIAKVGDGRKVVRGALIRSRFADYVGTAGFPQDEIRSWFPLVIDGAGKFADADQLQALTEAVSKGFD
jgi:hypothetical protein